MNNDTDSTRGPDQPEMHGPLGSALRFWGFVLASLVTLVALAWAVENWRGAMAWSAIKRDLVARREPLSFDQLVPPLPPDEQNFAATPLLRGLFDYGPAGPGQNAWRSPQGQARLNAITFPPTHEPPSKRAAAAGKSFRDRRREPETRIDLMPYALGIRLRPRGCPPNLDPALAERYGYLAPGQKWKKPTNDVEIAASITDPAQEVIEYLQRFDPELQEIAQAVQRPESQFAVHYAEGYNALLPHLAPLKQFTMMFPLRSAARLAKQDTAGAFEDVMTCLRLGQTVRNEPLLVSQLVGMAEHGIAVKAVWQGLASQQWNAEQLTAFQSQLARFNFQTQAILSVRGERAAQNEFLDQFGKVGRAALDAISPEQPQEGPMLLLLPWVPGWVRQNQARLNRYDDIQLRQAADPHWPASIVGALDASAPRATVGLDRPGPYTVVARLLAADLTKIQIKAARAQTLNHLAIVACALERFHLEHGAYPKDLSELGPRQLPGSSVDPMSGLPLHYELVAGGSVAAGFRLWSVGLNGRDDGGVMFEKNNDTQGDWVWPELGAPGPFLF
jgi:hypothetical protein